MQEVVDGVGRDLFGKERDLEYSIRLVGYWRTPGKAPPSWDQVAENILNELFGNHPLHAEWKNDLITARRNYYDEKKVRSARARAERVRSPNQRSLLGDNSQPEKFALEEGGKSPAQGNIDIRETAIVNTEYSTLPVLWELIVESYGLLLFPCREDLGLPKWSMLNDKEKEDYLAVVDPIGRVPRGGVGRFP